MPRLAGRGRFGYLQGIGCRRVVCAAAAAAAVRAHAVVPQAPVVRQRLITVVDLAYAEDPGSWVSIPK